MLIDSHVHLDDERYNGERETIIKSLRDNNVEMVINVGADMESSRATIELCKSYDNIYGSVGVHPHYASELDEDRLREIEEMSREDKIIAIGEIGLDFFYDNSPRDIQRYWFKRQLDLAKKLGLPVIIHARDADQEVFDTLKEAQDGSLRGVMHCYSGSRELAKEYVKIGFHLSLGGPVTFKNAKRVRDVADFIPLDRLLIETDGPYLTPVPYRGKVNRPEYVHYVAEKIAEVKGISYDELVEATSENVKKLFGIK